MVGETRETHQHGAWARPTEFLLGALLVAAIALGGAPNAPNWQVMILCAIAAALLPVALAAGAGERFASLPLSARIAIMLIPLIPLVQLMPLPPAIWHNLPGRELARDVHAIFGTEGTWRELSLVPRDTLFAFAMMLPAAATFLGVLTLDRIGRNRIVWVLLGASGMAILLGLIQFATKGASLDLYDTAHRGSFLGFFANRNHQGLLMAICGAYALTAISYRIRNPRMAMATATLIAMVFFIAAVGTLSRAGIGLTLIALGAAGYAQFLRGRLRWPVLVSGAAVGLGGLYFITFSSTVQQALDRFSRIEENGRLEIWQKSAPLLEQYLPWGAGVGSYVSVYQPVERLEDVSRLYFNRVHNDYLELALESGLPGMLVLALLAYVLGRRAFRILRGEEEPGAFATPAGLAIAVVAIHSIVDYPLRTQSHAVLFAMAAAFFLAPHRGRETGNAAGASVASWRSRSLRFKALGLTGQAAVVFAVALFAAYQKGAPEQIDRSGANLVNAEGGPMDPAGLATAKRALARHPLDQELLNAIYASEVRRGIGESERRAYVAALRRLGWRDTASQQNLLFEAARSNDLDAALDHMDALLRRDKLENQIIPLLAQLERDPQGLPLIARRLAMRPSWRGAYFAFADHLADEAMLDARMQLLAFMEENGMELARSEIRATLNALMRAGRREDIAWLALGDGGSAQGRGLLYDPEFNRMESVPAQQRSFALPFEWQLTNRSGVSAGIANELGEGQLLLRWNGRGAPILARTLTFLRAGEQPRLLIRADTERDLRQLDALRFNLICPGEAEVLFLGSQRSASGQTTAGPIVATYIAERAVPCDFPQLFVGGRPRAGDRGIDLVIDSIELELP